tara:strand:+ start:2125 stop:2370 length:246 start_codon:yes stop_codon:yes gene_type:complete
MSIESTINQIKYKKDVKYLEEKYGIPLNTISEGIGIAQSVMHNWMNSENLILRKENAIKLEQGLEKIKKLVKENEEYEPDF